MNHEDNLPLIAFTTLAPVSVGALIGLLPGRTSLPSVMIVLGVALLALAASVLHLGHPLRAFRAIFGLSSSWLSREVALFALYLLSLLIYAIALQLGVSGSALILIGVVAAGLGLAATVASGMVYRLRARAAWNSRFAVASFPLSALAAGLSLSFALRIFVGRPMVESAGTWAFWTAIAALVISPVLTALRLGRLRKGAAEDQRSWRLASGRHLWALLLRVGGPAVAVALLLTGGPGPAMAWLPALAGESAERVLFFETVVPASMPARVGVRGYGQGW